MEKLLKTVLITGASSGIGFACVHLFAQRGYRVLCMGRNVKRLNLAVNSAKQAGSLNSQAFVIDFQKPNAARNFFLKHKGLKRIDCLVNSAGIAELGGVQSITDADWEKVFRINVTASFAMIRECLPCLEKSDAASIVNISSIAGRLRSISLGSHYTASKAAVIGMTRHLAAELAPRGIRVNAICPGQTQTPMVDKALSKKEQRKLASRIPMKRLATPEELAQVIYFLASSESSYMTGSILDVNGGVL